MPMMNFVGSFNSIPADFSQGGGANTGYWDVLYSDLPNPNSPGSFNSNTKFYKQVNQSSGNVALFTIYTKTNSLYSVQTITSNVSGNVHPFNPQDIKYDTVDTGETIAMVGNIVVGGSTSNNICSINSTNLLTSNSTSSTYNLVEIRSGDSRVFNYKKLILNNDGSKIAAGNINYSSNSIGNGHLIKVDNTTNVLWQKDYTFSGIANKVEMYNIKPDLSSDNFYTVSHIEDTGSGNNYAVFTKFDTGGNLIWQKSTSNNVATFGHCSITASLNYAYAFVATNSSEGPTILQLDLYTGNIINSCKLAPDLGSTEVDIQYINGNLYIGYQSVTTISTNPYVLLSMDEDLNVNWARIIQLGNIETFYSYSFNIQSGVFNNSPALILAGAYSLPGLSGQTRAGTLKLPADGTIPGTGNYTITNYPGVASWNLQYQTYSMTTSSRSITLNDIAGNVTVSTYPVNTYTISLTNSTGNWGYTKLG